MPDSATVSAQNAVGCMLAAYSEFATFQHLGPRTSGLYREKAVGYMAVALEIDGPFQILLDRVRLDLLQVLFDSHNCFVAHTRLAAPAAAESHLRCRRTARHRRCRSLTVAVGQGLHSELVAGPHIVAGGHGHIYAGRSGGKTFR